MRFGIRKTVVISLYKVGGNMRTRHRVCLHLPDSLMLEARQVAKRIGLPLSRLAENGIRNQVNKWLAYDLLTNEELKNNAFLITHLLKNKSNAS